MRQRALVTGASGFVAGALIRAKPPDREFIAASRSLVRESAIEWKRSPALSGSADWAPLLDGIDSVVHLAGRVHRPSDADPFAYQVENSDGTIKLARDAAAAGVKRFVFLSTAKVVGDESGEEPYDESVLCNPSDPYAKSKYVAEQGLRDIGGRMQILILRPPLVYGPGVRANFLSLLSAVARGFPLPLASIRNRRSLIGVNNLASAILACLGSSSLIARTFHVTDGPARSTPELVEAIASALGQRARLVRFPPWLLEASGIAAGRGAMVRRLTRSFELDDTAIRTELGWRGVKTFEEEIADTVDWYLKRSVLTSTK